MKGATLVIDGVSFEAEEIIAPTKYAQNTYPFNLCITLETCSPKQDLQILILGTKQVTNMKKTSNQKDSMNIARRLVCLVNKSHSYIEFNLQNKDCTNLTIQSRIQISKFVQNLLSNHSLCFKKFDFSTN